MDRLNEILKPINDAMRGTPPAQLVKYVAIYMLISGIFSLCGGIGLMTAGALGGLGGALGAVAINASGADAATANEINQATSQLAAVSGFAIIWGILSVIAAPILLVAAFGLFQRAKWARMAAVIAFSINAIASLLGILSGSSGIFSLVWVLISAYLAYFFYTDSGIKGEFGQV
ncbi:MAG: hypothetical protein R3E39_19830 [Anaerolineae bacterium]